MPRRNFGRTDSEIMKLSFVIAIVVSAALVAFYAAAQPWGRFLVISTDMLFVLVSGVCALFGLLVVRKWTGLGKLGRAFLGLSIAIFLWFLGETVWAIYEVGLQVAIPYPSVADVFYLFGFVPATMAIFQLLSSFRKAFTRLKLFAATLVGIASIVPTYLLLIEPLLVASGGIITKTFDLAYPVLDTILLVMAVLTFMAFQGGDVAKPWRWISLGLLLTTIADIGFSYGTLTGWYYSGHPIELLWLFGYIAIALGFNGQRNQLFEVGSTLKIATGHAQEATLKSAHSTPVW